MNVPATREEAIKALIEGDVAQWGEEERQASSQMNARRSFGLALNELAARAKMAGLPSKDLAAAAKRELTQEDKKILRSGG